MTIKKQDIIKQLTLIEHREGGYFNETYRSTAVMDTDRSGKERNVSTSIYYMLTDDRPIGYFHTNLSDVVHYFHLGSALIYYLISPQGDLKVYTLGANPQKGEQMQLIVPGHYWKATLLTEGEFGLLGENVAPGFEYQDNRLATPAELAKLFPHLWDKISHLVHPER